ncbi:MAG: type IX secretion system sortase PorU [Muribaculaceae bacterium]
MIRNNILRVVFAVSFAIFAFASSMAFDAEMYAKESRLASGRWVKISVPESGVYKITASDIKRWGFSDINRVKVYGYGGAPISEILTQSNYVDDLPQVAVKRLNGEIYFYGVGPTTWTSGGSTGITYQQEQHGYSTSGYYFVTDADSDEPEIEMINSEVAVSDNASEVTRFVERTFYENELASVGESGRRLFGEDFRFRTSQTFKLSLPGYVPESEIKVLTRFVTNTQGGVNSKLQFKYNGTQLSSSASDEILPVDDEHQYVREAISLKTFSLPSVEELSYTIGLIYDGVLNVARLDCITVNYERTLAMNGGKLQFHYKSGSNVTFNLQGADANTNVWDVTDANCPVVMNLQPDGNGVKFAPYAMDERNYVAFDLNASIASPTYEGAVNNQNLHGEQVPDMIIITPKEFADQARRVAALHEANDNMRVMVVDPEKIYNEFSSGTPDVLAYRKLCKMFYDRGVDDEGHRLQYLLLFGSGSYDNRQLTDLVKANKYPMLLTWQSKESTSEYYSFTTDDILVMLNDNEGANLSSAKLSIAVGRMPVKSLSEAKSVVDKLYKYVSSTDYGSWKTMATVIADDQNSAVHMQQAESIISIYSLNGAENYQFNRIYVDAYDNKSSGGSRVCQVGRDKFYRQIDEGMFWLSYIGHANTTSWTGEQLLTWYDINNFYNKRWPFLFAATCNFAQYDANELSGGEIMYLNGSGGVIAELSATRVAYIPNNGTLNNAVAKFAFARDENNKHYTIGEFVRLGKNNVRDENRLRYVLFGDPAMRLRYPNYTAEVEMINGTQVNEDNMPTFQARQQLTFEGRVVDPDGDLASDFNGNIIATLYDAEQSVVTLGYGDDGKEFVFQDRSNRLAIVVDSVSNGRFKISLTVPSELSAGTSYDNYSPARICLYAYSTQTLSEAQGSNEQFYIYGYDETVEADEEGPEIQSFVLNSPSFADGDKVNETPLAIASIFDQHGINFSSGGIGHDITLQVDGVTTYNDVSSYFTPVYHSNGNAGTIAYPLPELTPGEHSLRLKVWDVFCNSSEKTIHFVVEPGVKPEFYDVYTTACPAVTDAVFYIKHNRPEALLNVTLQVYDLMGREVWSTALSGKNAFGESLPITWDLCDMSGRRVPRGIYVYRAGISCDGVHYSTKSKKIAVAGE